MMRVEGQEDARLFGRFSQRVFVALLILIAITAIPGIDRGIRESWLWQGMIMAEAGLALVAGFGALAGISSGLGMRVAGPVYRRLERLLGHDADPKERQLLGQLCWAGLAKLLFSAILAAVIWIMSLFLEGFGWSSLSWLSRTIFILSITPLMESIHLAILMIRHRRRGRTIGPSPDSGVSASSGGEGHEA